LPKRAFSRAFKATPLRAASDRFSVFPKLIGDAFPFISIPAVLRSKHRISQTPEQYRAPDRHKRGNSPSIPSQSKLRGKLKVPVSFLHATDATFSILLHNVAIGKGFTYSIDILAGQALDATTLYNALNPNPDKERVWEAVRLELGKDTLPSRMNGFFAFRSQAEAELAISRWGMLNKTLVEVVPQPGAKCFCADSAYLDCLEPDWNANAHHYWSGKHTAAPLLEVIISGQLFFPAWESFKPLHAQK
jgi:hypothetical protein